MAKQEKKKPAITRLTGAELRLISQVLYASRWTGQEWQRTITPLINKLARMVDERLTNS